MQELSRARSLLDVQEVVRAAARDLTGADGATFILLEEDECYYADEDAIAPLWKGRRFPIDECVSGWSMTSGEPVIVDDIRTVDRLPQDAYRPTFVRSLVIVPIRADAPLGAIGTYWAKPGRPSPTVVEIAQALADSTAIAMEHVQLLAELEARVAERTDALAERMTQLEESERRRRMLAIEAMHAEWRERALLSELIHDDVLQYVLAARQELAEAAKGDPAGIERARSDLDAAHLRLRALVAELSPVIVEASNLSDMIAAVVQTFADARDWTVGLQLTETTQTVHDQLLIRAARELLTNIAKHAHARNVTVTLSQGADAVDLCVADDGVGFDTAQLSEALRTGHVGLASLESRADAVGGTMIISSDPGGTSVTIRVPIADS